jgi:hypothetical protein
MISHLMSSSARLGIAKWAMSPGSHVAPCREYSGHACAGMRGSCERLTLNVDPVAGSTNVQVLVMGSMRIHPSNFLQSVQVLENPACRCCWQTRGGRNSLSQSSSLTYTPGGNSESFISSAGCASPLHEELHRRLSWGAASISITTPVASWTAHGGNTCVVMRTRMLM